MDFFTADLCDSHPERVRVLDPLFKNYGGRSKCQGEIVTVKLPAHNKTLVEVLKTPGENRMIVVDANGQYVAVAGENLMKLAKDNGWVGIIVNGYVRDIHITQTIDVVLLALGTCPKKEIPPRDGSVGESCHFGGITIHDGDYGYIDLDGMIVCQKKL